MQPIIHPSQHNRLNFYAHKVREQARHFWQSSPIEKAKKLREVLFYLFIATVATFPLGTAFRETGPILCLAILLPYYYWGWEQSTLKKLPLAFLFALFYGYIIIRIPLSTIPLYGLRDVYPHFWKGFALPFIAMEAIYDKGKLRTALITYIFVTIGEGLDGVWQAITGNDLIHNTPLRSGRLTGSMSTYRVGDFMAMVGVPACGLYYLLNPKKTPLYKIILTTLALSPGIFLWIFAQSRSAYLAVFVSLYILCVFILNRPNIKSIVIPPALLAAAVLLGPRRISLDTARTDGRWELWNFAWEVFIRNPIWGTGAATYNPAFRALGFLPTYDEPSIQHPHNIYLQFLCEMGLVGLIVGCLFWFGFLLWAYKIIRNGMRATPDRETYLHWRITAFFWAGWLAYLVNAFSIHNFYSTWWLALAHTGLGILIGACINAPNNPPTLERPLS